MQICSKCRQPQYRLRWDGGEGIGTDCGCLGRDRSRDSVHSPYEGLELEHVVPGKKIAVNSLRDVAKVEHQYGVVHAVTSYGENYIPPDQKVHNFNNGLYRSMKERGIQRRYRG